MGSFLKHVNCTKCGSSDAKALYEGGSSFCFSCRTSGKPSTSPYLFHYEEGLENVSLPNDAAFNYSPTCLAWVSKYGISVSELVANKVYWSNEKQQLIFTFWGNPGELLCWQARNFGAWAKTKYYTRGKPEHLLPIFFPSANATAPLVVVEDCISAIKISRYTASMPVLGSDLSPAKLKRLASVLEASRGIVVWLDGNMYHKAQRIASRLQMLGVEARAVYTELDPKEYTDEEIKKKLDKPTSL